MQNIVNYLQWIGAFFTLMVFILGAYAAILQWQFGRKYLPEAKKKLKKILPVNKKFVHSYSYTSLLIWPTNSIVLRTNFFIGYIFIIGGKYRHHPLIKKHIPLAEQQLCRKAEMAYILSTIGIFVIAFFYGV